MTRLLFLGDMAGSGFGTVTRDLGRALLGIGVDVRFCTLNETGGELEEPFGSRTAMLGQPSGWLGADDPDLTAARLREMFTGLLFPDGWAPEAALVLGDVGSLKVSGILGLLPDGFPAWHYVPIEGTGLPPAWRAIWQRLPPIACSEFGADQIAALGLPRPPVVYHGVDRTVWHPATATTPVRVPGGPVLRSREACRKFLGWPRDDVILFRADRNMPRKGYPALLRALAPVLAADQRVRLVWHCGTLDQGGDLEDERSKYHPRIAARMNSTGLHDRFGGAPREVLAAMYIAADLYVSNSSEGFGLTIAESIACGTPAVGIDFSSVPEVIGGAGVVVGGLRYVDNIYSHFWAFPDERLFGEAVRELVADPVRRHRLGGVGPIHAMQFDWARAAGQVEDIIRGGAAVEAAA